MNPCIDQHNTLVLVVDDDLVIQKQLRYAMEKEGYQVIVANNGQIALDICHQIHPDIVLLDAMMPVLDGFICCDELQKLYNNLPVLMITGLNDSASVDKAFAVGAADYITKPIHWPVLRQRVKRLLQMHWAMKELERKIEQEKLIARITQKIRQSLNLEMILNTTVVEVRKLLRCDRAIVYQFQEDDYGKIIVESVSPQWVLQIGGKFPDCACEKYIKKDHREFHIDIYNASNLLCQGQFANKLKTQASLIVPIEQENHIWGLLVLYQCSETWEWQQVETDLIRQLADQLAIAIQQAQLYQRLEIANSELRNLANIDGLTNIANRRCFDELLDREWKRLEREQAPLSLILCDIDFFKNYNDSYGHQMGDDCLKQVADILRYAIQRPGDLVARYGGEEFGLILPNTDISGAVYIAQTIISKIHSEKLSHKSSLISEYVTLSLGIATIIPQSTISVEWLIAKADKALYQAKEKGRDRFIIADIS